MDLQMFMSSLTTFTLINKDFIKDNNIVISLIFMCLLLYNNFQNFTQTVAKIILFLEKFKYVYSLSGMYTPLYYSKINNDELVAVAKTLINNIKDVKNSEIKTLTDKISFPYTAGKIIKFNEDISFASFYEDKTGSSSSINMYLITINLYANSFEIIKNFIKKCVEEVSYEILKTPKVFYCTGVDKDGANFNYVDYTSKKTFENIFFTEKENLKDKIKKFESSKETYDKLGIPYNFGMLFHGKPGTAKTSCCKAIANLTGRHIISISLGKINDIKHLSNIFLSDTIANIKIPTEKRLYVFDEADCNLFTKRDNDEENKESLEDKLDKLIDKKATDNPIDFSCNKKKIPIGELLELLDGIVETSGRMLIFITNYPEKLDPAMIRPGRVDEKIEFKFMTKTDINDMYHLWFNEYLDTDIVDKIKEERFSLADIGKIFRSNNTENIKKILSTSSMI
jgi:hypothetical protein